MAAELLLGCRDSGDWLGMKPADYNGVLETAILHLRESDPPWTSRIESPPGRPEDI